MQFLLFFWWSLLQYWRWTCYEFSGFNIWDKLHCKGWFPFGVDCRRSVKHFMLLYLVRNTFDKFTACFNPPTKRNNYKIPFPWRARWRCEVRTQVLFNYDLKNFSTWEIIACFLFLFVVFFTFPVLLVAAMRYALLTLKEVWAERFSMCNYTGFPYTKGSR